MTVSYEQARDLVRKTLESDWTNGTFCLDDRQIVENDELFVFEVGALEHIEGGDASFAVPGGVTVVYKEDGRIDSLPSLTVATDPTIHIQQNPNPTFLAQR
ncbi:hypothetical protein ACFXKF_32925 [Streptomyces scopuliridis]|uniref:hypothetical protein n=1 Tax=Streptomyces scopuliridis TaxID=452529 RepID=UPI0036C298D5